MRHGCMILAWVGLVGCGDGDGTSVDSADAEAFSSDRFASRAGPMGWFGDEASDDAGDDEPEHEEVGDVEGGLRVELTGLDAHEGAVVVGLRAFLSCGYWIAGRDEAVVEDGTARFDFEPTAYGWDGLGTLMVFVDTNGDGLCNPESEYEMFSVEPTADEAVDGSVTLEGGAMTPMGGWACTFLEQPLDG